MRGGGGSPPRVRGAPAAGRSSTAACRITPACTGSTRGSPPMRLRTSDHPRVYGEHVPRVADTIRGYGSPPRVRGARREPAAVSLQDRITPACTGSTVSAVMGAILRADHPRVYGEHAGTWPAAGTRPGSPPRVRGALLRDATEPGYCRITPACTGSTGVRRVGAGLARDHPRVYGEHQSLRPMRPSSAGSPPRVRGALPGAQLQAVPDRITPACTGSTSGQPGPGPLLPDHPRVYGEHAARPSTPTGTTGSPPRVRGAPDGQERRVAVVRITPACTGSTATRKDRRHA